MHVKTIYQNRIETFETRADGSARLNHAVLSVDADDTISELLLWSELVIQESIDDLSDTIEGNPDRILAVDGHFDTLQAILEAAGEQNGLLRLDVDGETLFQLQEEEDEDLDRMVEKGPDESGTIFL